MTHEQLIEKSIDHEREIAGFKESLKTVYKRIEKSEGITESIYKLSANMESLTKEVKHLADRLENGLREQGKRIGNIENAFVKLSNIEADIKATIARIDKMEKAPADKWNGMIQQITTLVIAAVVGAVIAVFTR